MEARLNATNVLVEIQRTQVAQLQVEVKGTVTKLNDLRAIRNQYPVVDRFVSSF